jgi:hypothetical protein
MAPVVTPAPASQKTLQRLASLAKIILDADSINSAPENLITNIASESHAASIVIYPPKEPATTS